MTPFPEKLIDRRTLSWLNYICNEILKYVGKSRGVNQSIVASCAVSSYSKNSS